MLRNVPTNYPRRKIKRNKKKKNMVLYKIHHYFKI